MKLTRYSELEDMVKLFASGKARLVLICSYAGTGKSFTALKILGEQDVCHVTTYSTSLQFYKRLYHAMENKQKIFIEDCESLFYDRNSISILKALTDSSPVRNIQWNSTTSKLEDTPQEFEVLDNPVLLTCNNLNALSKHLMPLVDRSHFVEFMPERTELLACMREIVNSNNGIEIGVKEKVYAIIEKYSTIVKHLSLRDFMRGCELYKYFQHDKAEEMLEKQLSIDVKLVQMRKAHENGKTTEQRLTRWKLLGYSERDFYRWQRVYKDCQTANKIQVYA